MSDDTKRGPTYAGTGAELPAIVCNEGHTNAQVEMKVFGLELTQSTQGYLA